MGDGDDDPMSGLDAGAMDREVTIQQLTESDGSSGYPVESWTTLGIEYMAKVQATGFERFGSSQLSAPATVRWRMYYRADMDPDSVDVAKKRRLLYQGRIYDITSAVEVGRQDGLELITLANTGAVA